MRTILATLALSTAMACGEDTLIILEVVSDLSIPNSVDGLKIALTSPTDGTDLRRVNLELNAKHEFPIEVGFYPNDNIPTVLEALVTGVLDDVPVAQIEVQFDWERGKLNRVELFPLEPL